MTLLEVVLRRGSDDTVGGSIQRGSDDTVGGGIAEGR